MVSARFTNSKINPSALRDEGTLVIYADGGARGNPGPAGLGVVIKDKRGKIISEISQFIGQTTNNQAEYEAVIEALRQAKKLKATSLEIFLDSSLLTGQLSGNFRVKNQGLKELFREAQDLSSQFSRVVFKYIPRRENKQADKLVNKAINLAGYR